MKERRCFLDNILRKREIFDARSAVPVLEEEYGPDGKIIISREAEKGSLRLNLTWHYDSQGNAVSAERDSDGDGRVDIWYYYKDGRIARVVEDRNRDGRPDLWEIYDSSQKVAMRKEDVDFDGTADIEKRF